MLILLTFFLIFVAGDLFFAAAVIHHLRSYTLPSWIMAKFVVLIYLALSFLFLAFAVYFFLRIPNEVFDMFTLPPMIQMMPNLIPS